MHLLFTTRPSTFYASDVSFVLLNSTISYYKIIMHNTFVCSTIGALGYDWMCLVCGHFGYKLKS